MKLLILGGTIFLGRHLVESAVARGHEVTLFNRGRHDAPALPDVEKLQGNRRGDLHELNDRLWDSVIDTSGYVPGVVRSSARMLSGAVDHYTFVSSQSVYANFDIAGIDETHPVKELTEQQLIEAEAIDPGDGIIAVGYGELYGGLKAACERVVEEEMPGRALRVRAGLIVGPYDYSDRFTYWVRRLAEGGEVLAPGECDRPVQFVDVRDLADWLVSMAETRQTGTFNATGPDHRLTMEDLLCVCREASNSDGSFTWVSDEFLKSEGVAGWTELPLWLPAEDMIANFFSIEISKATRAGLVYRPLLETARDTLLWDKTNTKELRAGLSRERENELLQAWHEVK